MNPKQFIDPAKSKTFASKTKEIQDLINHALFLLEAFGIPIDQTPRRQEKMAMAFLAVGDIKSEDGFATAKDLQTHSYALTTREIINYNNQNFGENISSGSYDDIRRKDLKLLVIAGIVLRSSPNSATNDSRRGYGLAPKYANFVRQYPSKGWGAKVQNELREVEPLSIRLKRLREMDKIPVSIPGGGALEFSPGAHNQLQKAIIEDFLPRYGYGAQVAYVGDTSDKYLLLDEPLLESINFFQISHEELPDVLAYSKTRNWLYLIEAVHSSGPISETRLLQLRSLTEDCSAEIIYVTAFLDRATFRRWAKDIAWETEVWIAENPDHLIHFNGDKFLGPYSE